MTATVAPPAQAATPAATLQSKFQSIINEMKDEIVGHDEAVLGVWLAALARVPMMMLGSPGIGKTAIMDGVLCRLPDFRQFAKTANEFDTIDDWFGPTKLSDLKNDRNVRQTKGYLPDAEIAALDEFPRTTGPVAGNLLNLLQEGYYFDGEKRVQSDLRFTLLAANYLPDEEEAWGAVLDRIVLRYDVKRIAAEDHGTRLMILSGSLRKNQNPTIITREEMEQAWAEVEAMQVSGEFVDNFLCQELMPKLHEMSESVFDGVSDRRVHKGIEVAKAMAWLMGADEVKREHGIVYAHILWNIQHEIVPVQELVAEKSGATSITIEGNTMPEELTAVVEAHAAAMQAALQLPDSGATLSEIGDSTTAATAKLRDIENDWTKTLKSVSDRERKLAKIKDALTRVNDQMQATMQEYTASLQAP